MKSMQSNMDSLFVTIVSFIVITGFANNSSVRSEPRSLSSITPAVQELLDVMDNDAVTHRMNLIKTAAVLTGLDTRINNKTINLSKLTIRNTEPDFVSLELVRKEIFEALYMKYLTFKSLLDMKLCKTFYTHIKHRRHSAMNCNNAMVAIGNFYDKFKIGKEVEMFPILSEVADIMKKNDKRLKKLMRESTMSFPITDLIRDWDKIPDAEKKFTEIIARKLDEEKRRVNDISSSSKSESNESGLLPDLAEFPHKSRSFRFRSSFRRKSSEFAPYTVKSLEGGQSQNSDLSEMINRVAAARLNEVDNPSYDESTKMNSTSHSKQIFQKTENTSKLNELEKSSPTTVAGDSPSDDVLVHGISRQEVHESDLSGSKLNELDRSDVVKLGLVTLESAKLKPDNASIVGSAETGESWSQSRDLWDSSDMSRLEEISVDEEESPLREALMLRRRYGLNFPGSVARYDPRLILMMEEQRRIALRNEAISGLHDLMWEEALSLFGDYLPDVDNFFNDALNRKEAFLTSLHDMIPEGVDEITPYWTYIARQAKILYMTNSAEGESSLKRMREYVLQAESEKRQTVNYEKIQLASMNLLFRSKRYADFTVAF